MLVYDRVSLMGDIGGLMGLFLGASLLSFYDLGEELCKLIAYKVFPRSLNKVKE